MQKATELSNSELNAMIAQDQGWECLNVDWIPNYANDLNAMHFAEKTLPVQNLDYDHYIGSKTHYRDELALIAIQPIHATARQRAEAYAITKRLAQ